MSFINDRDFPIVYVNIGRNEQEEHSHAEDFKGFEKLVNRQQKFVLINEGGSPDTDHKHNREDTKMVNNFRLVFVSDRTEALDIANSLLKLEN